MSISHPTLLPPVRTAEDLTARWQLLLADRPAERQDQPCTDLWVQTHDAEGQQLPALIVIDDVPERPDPTFVANLAGILHTLLAEETAGIGAVAFALAPDRRRGIAAADLQWATDLAAACAAEDVRVLGVHLVADDEVTRIV